ncbi:heme lyase CcmF/NrfE family subunit [Azospira sp. APE16]|jgi:cytochrome c-type biogenesis protein CcmF|uniref:heme lyase CcmF/NrfE family subunit n=1 Tax=Azospira sp. APE16 TaxID=3394231 RepID=UPI0009694848|nr:heme lyase CcmF/NrfE family subunit [Accumulibacter sp.]OJW51510.1 MAG: c-type cytochrome biogenesis protein CcmF [Candidatus Accumulibacter sp. 66-26]
MIPEIGHFALILALCVSVVQGTLPLIGAAKNSPALMSVARPAAQAQFAFIGIAFACLVYAFVGNDFSVINVARNSNSNLPLFYLIAASWGSHEGSMLLWVTMLAAWGLAVSIFSARLPDEMVARVLGVMGCIAVGFHLFLLLTSNPFERLLPAAPDGRDLNPLLQDPGMVFHPPLLYMGYVGFSVAFAFAIAALLGGRLDAVWARWSRPWTTAAWCSLTLGIALGSWWAYYELGWGGWWFWDPVENASFMPWLVGTALMHSLAVTEKRGSFKSWTVLLAIVAFALSLLGTFLVRSGILTSVHAFATDPKRGIFILAFLVIVIGLSLTVYAWRAPKVGTGGAFALVSRESLLLVNNVLLVVASASVLLGTLYPLFLDALGLGKISVGPPYFDAIFAPLMVPVVLLMAIAPFVRWKQAALGDIAKALGAAFVVALIVAVALPFLMGRWSTLTAVGILIAVWLALSSIVGLWDRIKGAQSSGDLWSRIRSLPRAFYGMHLAHFGIAVFIFAVAMVKTYEESKDVKMKVGTTVSVGGYRFEFAQTSEIRGPNYRAVRATINVARDGEQVGTMFPEKRTYDVQRMPMTEAAIDYGLTRDLYVALGEPLDENTWVVRVHHKPFVNWIWIGCIFMALGGALAASDRRYRAGARRASPQETATAAAAA